MFSAERILLLAGVALAAHAALVSAYCTTDSIGDLTAMPIKLPEVKLPPPTAVWNIQIPDVENCERMGVEMTCCDDEDPPLVHLSGLSSATVERRGPRRSTATVATTVYCFRPRRPGRPSRPGRRPAPRPSNRGWIAA